MTQGAAIYCRISKDPDGTELGVQRQEKDCRAWCDTNGWPVAAVLVDDDRSAYTGKPRPSYERLLSGLQSREYDAVVAWHPDRLHRSPRELEAFIDLLNATKAKVATVQAGEYDLSTASARMTARVVGAVARHESEQKSERLRRKHLELAEAGKVSGGGARPFGFNHDRRSLDHDEAALIRDAAERALTGASVRSIAAGWTEAGVLTSTGKRWTPHVVRRLLCSPRIAGLRAHHGQIVGKAEWPAIIDERTSARLRALLLDPARRVNGNPRKYLLTGLAYCGLCEQRLVARPRADKKRCYVCASGPGFVGCGKIRVLAGHLEEYVGTWLADFIDSEEVAVAEAETDPDPVLAALADDEAALEQLAQDHYADRLITRGEYLAARQVLEGRVAAARRSLVRSTERDLVAALVAGDGSMVDRWDGLGFDAQRVLLTARLERVVVGSAVRGRNFFDSNRVAIATRG